MSKKLTKKQKKQVTKFALANWKVLLIIFLIVVLLVGIAYYTGLFDKFLKKKEESVTLSTAGGYTTNVNVLNNLKINFIDVGQGDCIIIELPDGKKMIIDSGKSTTTAKNNITNFTTSNNITTFDYMILTHQDSDHAGNMSWVIDNYDIKYIFKPATYSSNSKASNIPESINYNVEGGIASTSATYANFLVSANNEGCVIEVFNKDSDFSNTYIYNDTSYSYQFDFLTPVAERNKIAYSSYNNYSPIFVLKCYNRQILFSGDAELEVLQEYIDNYGSNYNIDIMKVGHHGSDNATTQEFVAAVDPEYAVIQCGKGNSYKHPLQSVIDIFQNHDGGVELYRNDTNGLVTLNISNSGAISFDLEIEDCSNNYLNGEAYALLMPNFSDYMYYRSLVA